MWEYLSLYGERDNSSEAFTVKHYPERNNRMAESVLLNQLGADGWELVAVVPAYSSTGLHDAVHHQLYFKRPRGEARTTRLDR